MNEVFYKLRILQVWKGGWLAGVCLPMKEETNLNRLLENIHIFDFITKMNENFGKNVSPSNTRNQ